MQALEGAAPMWTVRQSNRAMFGLAWIVVNAGGYAVGLALWEAASRPLWPALSGILLGGVTLGLYGATLGRVAGLARVLVLRRRAPAAALWVAGTTVGLGLGFVVGAWAAFVVSQNGAIGAATNALYASSSRLAGTLFRESLVNIAF